MKQISFFGRSSVSAAFALTNGRPSADRRVRYGMNRAYASGVGVARSVGDPSGIRRERSVFGPWSKWCRIAAVWLLLLTLGVGQVWGATKTEGFETATVATSYNSTATITTIKSDCSIAWSIYYGNVSSTGKITGNNSCLMRWYSLSSSKLGYARTTTPIKGLSNVTFNAKVTSTGHKMGVWYSTNGENWTALATNVTLATTPAPISYDIPNSSTSTDYYIKIGITEATADKKDLIIDDVVFTYSTATSYTITALSSNNSHGTVSVSGTTITATPANCYQVVSGDGGYTLNSGNASITHTGTDNTLIVTPTSNCSITVNFERKATNTYIDEIQDNGTQELCDAEAPALDDKTAATTGTCAQQHWHFVGWVTESNKTHPTKDNIVKAGTEIAVNGTTYYAVWSKGSASKYTLDYANESGLSSSTSWGAYGTSYEYTATDGGKWTIKAYKSSGMQINTKKNSSIKIPTCSGNISSISITCSAAKSVGFSTSDYTGSGTITYVAYGTDATLQTLDFTGKTAKVGYIVPKGGSTSITKVVVNYGTYSDSIASCCESLGEIKGSVDSTQ